MIERAEIWSEPKACVSFTRQESPRAASQAAKVNKVRMMERLLMDNVREKIKMKIAASRKSRIIRKWDLWRDRLRYGIKMMRGNSSDGVRVIVRGLENMFDLQDRCFRGLSYPGVISDCREILNFSFQS